MSLSQPTMTVTASSVQASVRFDPFPHVTLSTADYDQIDLLAGRTRETVGLRAGDDHHIVRTRLPPPGHRRRWFRVWGQSLANRGVVFSWVSALGFASAQTKLFAV
jgi:hypothetical protein